MIKYAVECKKGHGFEAWFQNSDAFDKQTKRGLLACPECGSTKISKSLMAPHVSAKTRKGKTLTVQTEKPSPPAPTAAPQVVAAPQMALPAEMVEVLRRIKKEVESRSDYVGDKFAEEARKIHYNEAPERGIYGKATLEDVQQLAEEGIDCLPLPVLPEDRN